MSIKILIYPFILSSSFYISRKIFLLMNPKPNLQDQKIFYPKNNKDITNIIHKYNEISIIGAGFSQGQQMKSDGPQINLRDYEQKLIVNDKDDYIIVSANKTWADVEKELIKYNKYIKIRQASNIFSIGGSISTNVHGWAHKDGTISNILKSLTIVNSEGCVQKIDKNDDMFKYIVGSYGLFGPIIEAEIFISNNEILEEKGYKLKINDYIDYYQKNVLNNDNIKMHLFRLSINNKDLLQNGIVVNYQYPDEVSNNETKVSNKTLEQENQYGTYIQRRLLDLAMNFQNIRNLYWSLEESRLINNKISKTTLEHMQVPIRAMHKSYNNKLAEFFIPGTKLKCFINDLNKIITENKIVLLNASIRPVIKDFSILSYAKSDMFAVVICVDDNKNFSIMINDLIKKTITYNGTYYLPYQFLANILQFRECYPDYENFIKFKNKKDPNNKFSNQLYTTYFTNPALTLDLMDNKIQIKQFIDNILMTIDSDKLLDNKNLFDNYSDLLKNIHLYKKNILYNFRSLFAIQKDLSQQVYEIITANYSSSKQFNGMLEIGYSGRFIKDISNKININGLFHVMNTQTSFTDIFEHGLFKKHTKSFKLDYINTDFENIEDNSYDIITCFVGLHHFKDIPYVIKSINRILKYDGLFVLVEHDAYNKNIISCANIAHSLFNASNGVILSEELKELRNFKSINEWISQITQYGFEEQKNAGLVREGDPTLNTMISFVKKDSKELVINKYDGRNVKLYSTFLTAVEWRNVDMAKELSVFIKEGNSFYTYPYLEQCFTLWKIFYNSYVAALKYDSFYNIVFSGYTIMNLFILLSNSLGLITKTIISLPLRIIKVKNKTNFQDDLANEYYENYHNFILNKGFYLYPFLSKIKTIWSSFINNTDTSIIDVITLIVVSCELLLCGLLCMPVKQFVETPTNLETVLTLSDKTNSGISHKTEIILQRYNITEYISKLAEDNNIEINNICNQKLIMVSFVTDRNQYVIEGLFGSNLLYTYKDNITNKIYFATVIPTKDLIKIINECSDNEIFLKFIHDF